MPLPDGNLKNAVNTVYLTAASAAGIPAVSKEISALLPGTTVTTASSLAGRVTGSLTSAVKLADALAQVASRRRRHAPGAVIPGHARHHAAAARDSPRRRVFPAQSLHDRFSPRTSGHTRPRLDYPK